MAGTSLDIEGHTVAITNTDKLFYPDAGHTKGDVIAYYRAVADVMVPHLRGRPLSLHRFPDGLAGGGFYQKKASGHFPAWIRTTEVLRRGEHDTISHVLCDSAAALVYLANQGCLEFHVWTSRAGAPERPDRLVIDLDPADTTTLADVRATATQAADLCTAVGLVPFVQTTGGRGYHVVAPLDGDATFDVVQPLASGLASRLAAQHPDRLTVEFRKAKRDGRLFLDTGRNAYGQMAVAPYSLRARPGAPAAAPLDWPELGRVAPHARGLTSMPRRLGQKPDPWRDIDAHAGSAVQARRRLEELNGATR